MFSKLNSVVFFREPLIAECAPSHYDFKSELVR